MQLGEKLKQARLAAGLSQRQLCADTITRNMLSQIENGSARPSMSTLQVLARRLNKPVSYFLEEDSQSLLEQARQLPPRQALSLLQEQPEGGCEQQLLLLENYLALAEEALQQGKTGYAQQLLTQAEAVHCPYGELFQTRLILLRYQAEPRQASALAKQLPSVSPQLMLLAQAAYDSEDYDRCARLLDAVDVPDPQWYLLRGSCCMQQQDWQQAAQWLRQAETDAPGKVYPLLECCYRQLRDFEKAYDYACRQRDIE